MSDADLIYNALLRAERRLDEQAVGALMTDSGSHALLVAASIILTTVREEVGRGLAQEHR